MIHLLTSAAVAGVWVREPGAGYGQLTLIHQVAERVYLEDGTLVSQADAAVLGDIAPVFEAGRYSATDLTAYGELGVARGIEVFGSLPLRLATNRWTLARGTYGDIVHHNVGAGDLALGGRVGGQPGGWAVSGALTGSVPLYDNSPARLNVQAGNSDFEDDRVPLGQGTWDLAATGGVGRGSARAWALAEAGIRARSRAFSLVVPARLQLGVKPVDGVALWAGTDLAWSLGNGAAPDAFRDRWGKGPIAIDNQRSVSVGIGGAVALAEGVGLIAGVSRVAYGVRFPLLTSGSLGVTWEGP